MSRSRIFLIDANALCYRAFYAVKELRNAKGQPTNAVFGFLNILRKLLKDHAPEYMAVCFDVSKKTLRQERYAAYKVQRPSMPEDLAVQIPVIKDVVRAYRIPIFEKEGYEADDIIATLAGKFSKDTEVVIVTDDKDMYQLVSDRVWIYNSRKDAILGVEETRERFGLEPKQILDYIALAGDASDNIPGVYGIGEVTARKLIAEFGSVENVLENAGGLKGKLKDKVLEGRDAALMSKELATLNGDMDLGCSLEDIRVQAPDRGVLASLLTELEFRSFLREIERAPVEGQSAVEQSEVVLSHDPGGLVTEALTAGRVALSVVSGENDAEEGERFYACVGGSVCVFSAADVKILKKVFEAGNVVKILWDLKATMKALSRNGLVLEGPVFDCFLAGYLLSSGRSSHDIDALAWTYLKRQVPNKEAAAWKVQAIFDLKDLLEKDLKDKDAFALYDEVEVPLARVLFGMEQEGVRIDTGLLEELAKTCEARINSMTGRLHSMAGEEFNLNSPKQLGVVLFEKLKLPVVKRTKTGYSTDEEVLTRLASKHELPALILEYRQTAKLKSTYIDALPRLVDPGTGRIHCSFNQAGTETGRLSSNHPNLQNIPVRTEMGREIRKAFVASDKGRVLVSADYSQIELRVLAHIADEPNLQRAFHAGEDIHSYTAGLMFDVAEGRVTPEMRYSAKRINFGIIYGMSAFGLARDLGVSHKEAQMFIDRYFLRYPGIQKFMEREIEKARERGFSETLFLRRRYLPDINSRNPAVRQFAERQAINTPVQGTAADLIKMAMVDVARALADKGSEAKMIVTVHDELVFDVDRGRAVEIGALVRARMEGAVSLSVPVKVTVKTGMNWAEMI